MTVRYTRLRTALLASVVSLLLAAPLPAAITTTGDVTPDPSTTTLADDLYVGNTADGTLFIDGRSSVGAMPYTLAASRSYRCGNSRHRWDPDQ